MNPSTSNPGPSAGTRKLIVALVILTLLFTFFLLPAGAAGIVGPWLWFEAVFILLLLWSLFARSPAGEQNAVEGPHMLSIEEQPNIVREVMDVRLAEEDHGVRLFRGRLRASADAAYAKLRTAFGDDTVPLVQPDDRCGAAILLMPHPVERARLERRPHRWVNWLLFVLTLATTTWAGAMHQGVNLLRDPAQFTMGLPYAVALLVILGVHELGHYWAARRHGMNVTPPYFIPAPFALGTFGAFIRMRSPSETRRMLFDVAVAGPLAGLVVAIPALLIGLRSSAILPASSVSKELAGALPHTSILFTLLAKWSLGAVPANAVVQLSPIAFAGWLGLFITGLNLLPIGQLDGGHIARAMFGSRVGSVISNLAMWSLLLLGLFVWPGLLTWALIVFFIAGRGTPPLNDITPVTTWRLWLGWFAFVVLVVVLVPMPAALEQLLGGASSAPL